MTPMSLSTSRFSLPIWIVAFAPCWSTKIPKRRICMVLNPTSAILTSRMSRPMTLARLPIALIAPSVLSTAAAFNRTNDSTASSVFTGLMAAQSLMRRNVASASCCVSMTARRRIRYCSMSFAVFMSVPAPRRRASNENAAAMRPPMRPREPSRPDMLFCASSAALPVSLMPRFAPVIPALYCDESNFRLAYSCATSIYPHPPNNRRKSSGVSRLIDSSFLPVEDCPQTASACAMDSSSRYSSSFVARYKNCRYGMSSTASGKYLYP